LRGGNQTGSDPGLANPFVVKTAPVVLHFDEHVIAAMKSADRYFSARGFPCSFARRRILDPMRDGVADQMNQGIRDLLHDVVIETSVFSNKFQIHGLAANLCGVARGAREPRVQIADGHHARFGDFILEVVSKLGEFIDVSAYAADKSAEL